jgi:hypothetical protein
LEAVDCNKTSPGEVQADHSVAIRADFTREVAFNLGFERRLGVLKGTEGKSLGDQEAGEYVLVLGPVWSFYRK